MAFFLINSRVGRPPWSGAYLAVWFIAIGEAYVGEVCCFNDDIQGSGAAVLAGMLSAMSISGARLRDQTFLILGAGSAAIGIAQMLAEAMGLQGLSRTKARERVWLFNRNGLIESTRLDLTDYQKAYAHVHEGTSDFAAAVESIRPTAIIGVSTAVKTFNQRVIEAMARINQRPIVFAPSNPTSCSECSAEEAYGWSGGRAVFASGSPFPATHYHGQPFEPGQCNNACIFPAIGLAVYATVAARVTDEMFLTAAHAIAERVGEADLGHGLVYPPQSALLDSEIHAACRVAEVIFARRLSRVPPPDDLRAFIEARVYNPRYETAV